MIIECPKGIMDFLHTKSEEKANVFEHMWNALNHAFCMERGISTTLWMEYFNDDTLFNAILKKLSEAGLVSSSIDYNYAELKLTPKEFVLDDIYKYKWMHYNMTSVSTYPLDNSVKLNNKIIQSGLVRKGFSRVSQRWFRYDTKPIREYKEYIAKNIYKEISNSTKDVKYEEIRNDLLEYYQIDNINYTLGSCIMDSRGRSIFDCTHKIFNPVSHKDARASVQVICAQQLRDYTAVYLFVAELLGYKPKTLGEKIEYGKEAVSKRTLPSLEEMIDTNDFSSLHERIWLERIYENFSHPHTWYVPIELDATASMLQVIGALLHDHDLLDYTNVINGTELKDAWTIDGVPRKHVKKACTPRLYGSSAEPRELWNKHHLKYTQKQINIVTKEIREGRFARANAFKDFIINNVNPQPHMRVRIFDEEFDIECNRFQWGVTERVSHMIYTSQQGLYKECIHEVERIPDLKQFKRYFMTLLIHNLDSQISNQICLDDRIDFIIPNHDAWIIHPNDSKYVREDYTNALYRIYNYNEIILRDYFRSIGLTKPFSMKREVNKIKEFEGTCLK